MKANTELLIVKMHNKVSMINKWKGFQGSGQTFPRQV